jgi:hypothetical protein
MNNGLKRDEYVNRVLNTNDCSRLVSSFIASLMTVAEPEQIRRALVGTLNDWDEKVRMLHDIHQAAIQLGEARAKAPPRSSRG